MTEQNKTTIQTVEPGIETMDAPALPRKERKSKTIEESQIIQIERKLLSSLGIHEADALAACIAIGAGNQEAAAVKGSDRHRLNLYLISQLSDKQEGDVRAGTFGTPSGAGPSACQICYPLSRQRGDDGGNVHRQ